MVCFLSQEEEIGKLRELDDQNQKLKNENEQYKQVKAFSLTNSYHNLAKWELNFTIEFSISCAC